jgi:hypothetical protein
MKFKAFTLALSALACIFSTALHAQNVGIGTSTPLEKLHVAGEVRVNGLAGVANRVVSADPNGTLVIVPAGTTGQVLTQTATGPVFQNGGALNVTSIALAADYTVTTTAFTNVTGMAVTFTATKTSALVMFSAAGFAYTNSMAYVVFRIRDGATTLGGTNTITQNYDDVTGTVTPWSCSFIKNITGLTVGTSYTYRVQAQRNGILGTYDTVIQAGTSPDSHHMTLTVLQ